MEKKEEKKEKWEVKLVIMDESKPPQKFITNNENIKENLDLYAAMAKILNKLETIKNGILE